MMGTSNHPVWFVSSHFITLYSGNRGADDRDLNSEILHIRLLKLHKGVVFQTVKGFCASPFHFLSFA